MEISRIKRLALVAMVSDDELLDLLVLKGGNALNIGYGISPRASKDIDFSIQGDLSEFGFSAFEERISQSLVDTFGTDGYQVFDVQIRETPLPELMSPENRLFWGGYTVEFKLTPKDRYISLKGDRAALRRDATVDGPGHKRKFTIDISKFEYCKSKKQIQVDGYRVYVYTPDLLIAEKLRAICQQMRAYTSDLPTHARARAADFYDIAILCKAEQVDIRTCAFRDLIAAVFAAKRVNLELLKEIPSTREYHRQGFDNVRDTIPPGEELEEFDYYFDYTVDLVRQLKPLWEEQSPRA